MIFANRLRSLDYSKNKFDKSIDYYFAAVYVNTETYLDENGIPTPNFTYYNSTPCRDLFPDKNDIQYQYLQDWNCP